MAEFIYTMHNVRKAVGDDWALMIDVVSAYNQTDALRVGRALGFRDDEIHADLLPEDKVELVAALADIPLQFDPGSSWNYSVATDILGAILQRLGVVPQQIAGGDIYAALERGTIDAAEFSGPFDDEKLGFQKVAQHYYYPGWWEGTANVGLYVNLDKWNGLPKHYQAALEAACSEAMSHCIAKYDNGNPDALLRLIGAGAQLRAFPDDVLAAAFAESRKLYAEYAASNENFRRIYDHWSAYWTRQQQWLRVAELPYDYFTSAQVAAG